MKVNQVIAGVQLRRSIGFRVGEVAGTAVSLRQGTRGHYRWFVQRLGGSQLLGRGSTAKEAVEAARQWLAQQAELAKPASEATANASADTVQHASTSKSEVTS